MPKFTLMQHQDEGVQFLDDHDGIAALLWDPGVGKTGAAMTWIDRLAAKQGEVRVLVVTLLTATDTWVIQAPPFMDSVVKARVLSGSTVRILDKIAMSRDWTQVPDEKIQVDHIGTVPAQIAGQKVTMLSMSAGAVSTFCAQRVRKLQMLKAIRKYAPHVIIVDESQIIKSHNSNISDAMYAFGQLAPHRIILTGTVAPHSPLDVYGQWRFMAPWTFSDQYSEAFTKDPLRMTKDQRAAIKPWAWGRFRDRYAEMGGYGGKNVVGMSDITIDELHNRVAERSHVVKKEDALDLPPVTDVPVHVTLSTKEAKAYREMRDELLLELENGQLLEAPNALAKYMKLRQVTAGLAKDTTTGQVHIIGDSKRKAQIEVANVTLGGEQRLVLFGYFTTECHLLAEKLRKIEPNTTVEVITGATKGPERLDIRRRFGDVSGNPQRMILVAQQRTMSVSVNELVTAQNALYGSLSERRDDLVQSRGRLDRNGQEGSHVTFWNVFVPGTVDEVMLMNHQNRGDLEKAMLDHIRTGGVIIG